MCVLGGGGAPRTAASFYSAKLCIKVCSSPCSPGGSIATARLLLGCQNHYNGVIRKSPYSAVRPGSYLCGAGCPISELPEKSANATHLFKARIIPYLHEKEGYRSKEPNANSKATCKSHSPPNQAQHVRSGYSWLTILRNPCPDCIAQRILIQVMKKLQFLFLLLLALTF